jgi:hypothetical protein
MFAKRKPRQDDEPLVPHGLVWQATDAPETSEPAEIPVIKKTLATESESAQRQPIAPSQVAGGTLPKKPSVSSPPLFWHSRRQPETVKETSITRSDSEPEILTAPPVASPGAAVQQSLNSGARVGHKGPSMAQQFRAKGSEIVSASQRTITRLASDFRRYTRDFGRRFHVEMEHVGAGLRTRRASLNLATRFHSTRHSLSSQFWQVAARLRRYRANCKTLGNAYFTKAVAYTKLRSEHLHVMRSSLLRRESLETPRRDEVLKLSKRVRLAGFPLRLRILFTRAISEWRLKANTAGTDSRLLRSMTMALCTALLALGLVSSARHYGNASLPSRLVHSSTPQAPAVATLPTVISTKPTSVRNESAAKEQGASTVRPRPMPTARPAPTAQSMQTARPRPKPRRGEDDDYVARDTYVYYGDSRAKSR